MTDVRTTHTFFSKRIFIISGISFSGLCWYLANGLSGNYWYLSWIAPIPLLIASMYVTGRMTFIISFIAYLIGRLSWFTYLTTVATTLPAIIFTLTLPLIFAFIVLLTRNIVLKTDSWYGIFAFPVFFTSFEFLLIIFSADGTATSIAYSQLNCLPIIQIASITGILGITFVVTFIPSAITGSLCYHKEKNKFRPAICVSVVILMSVFLFGIIRLSDASQKSKVKVGLAVLAEKFHYITDQPDYQKEIETAELYALAITHLSAQGAQLVTLPERAININKETDSTVMHILTSVAKKNRVVIITGYTNFRNDSVRNSALVIDADGNVLADYHKVHLVKGLEHQFIPGGPIGLFTSNGMQSGVAICKDLDFPGYIKKYSRSNISVLYVPAWDFVVDDWLHSRMAILRGVENGFSVVRTARQGRLTISDCYGRITSEASSTNGVPTALTGKVSLQKKDTFYTHWGDWFGIVNIIAAGCFIIFKGKKRKRD